MNSYGEFVLKQSKEECSHTYDRDAHFVNSNKNDNRDERRIRDTTSLSPPATHKRIQRSNKNQRYYDKSPHSNGNNNNNNNNNIAQNMRNSGHQFHTPTRHNNHKHNNNNNNNNSHSNNNGHWHTSPHSPHGSAKHSYVCVKM